MLERNFHASKRCIANCKEVSRYPDESRYVEVISKLNLSLTRIYRQWKFDRLVYSKYISMYQQQAAVRKFLAHLKSEYRIQSYLHLAPRNNRWWRR